MGYSRRVLKTYGTDELTELSEQFTAALTIAKPNSQAYRSAAIAKSNVDYTLLLRRTSR